MNRPLERRAAETPLMAIDRLARTAASGELIIASDNVEIHVYLLEGRLAWATSSTAKNAFVRHLVDQHGVAADALRDVIEECQRTRRRLGETLIGWGIATAEQVRDALAAQIVETLDAAQAHPGASSLFLPRRMDYALELTFAFEELVAPAEPVSLSAVAEEIVAAVLDGVPEALWVEIEAGGEVVSRAVRGSVRPTDLVHGMQRRVHEGDIDSLVVRTACGALLGQRLPEQRASVWCAVGADAKLGVASAVLASAVGAPTGAARPLAEVDDTWQEVADRGVGVHPSVFAGAMRTADLVAAFALGATGGQVGCWRGPGGPWDHPARARPLVPLLSLSLREALPQPVGSILYEQVALRAVAGGVAYFGTGALDGAASVWLVLRPDVSQGLGWALLQAVARQVREAGVVVQGGG